MDKTTKKTDIDKLLDEVATTGECVIADKAGKRRQGNLPPITPMSASEVEAMFRKAGAEDSAEAVTKQLEPTLRAVLDGQAAILYALGYMLAKMPTRTPDVTFEEQAETRKLADKLTEMAMNLEQLRDLKTKE